MLTLPIKKQWFDMIVSGVKTQEYRKISDYYKKRFDKIIKNDVGTLLLRNGYHSNSPTIEIKFRLTIGEGKEEWGAVKGEKYFILNIINFEQI